MRTADLPTPPVAPHPIPPDAPISSWPLELTVAIRADVDEPPVWDGGGLWDDTGPTDVWDAPDPDPEWVDAVCDWSGLVIDQGVPDELGLFPAVQLSMTLNNRSGVWSTWTASGRLARFPVGAPVAVWTTDKATGNVDWLFAGYTAQWHQAGDLVDVVAYDGYADLAGDAGAPWTAGVLYERPLARLAAYADLFGWPGVLAGDVGHTDLLLATFDPDVSPLEAMQRVALSDGGVLAGDVDGQVLYRDRFWREGRADQPAVPTFTDYACDAGGALVTWDPIVGADDVALFNAAVLTNVADITVTASTGARRPLVLTHPAPDLWPDTDTGAELAWHLVNEYRVAGYRVDSFALHVGDPNQPALWTVAPALRRGDRFRWVTDVAGVDGPIRLDLFAIVAGVRHDITPDAGWLTTVTGTRAVAVRTSILWDDGHVWDDTPPDEWS